MKLWSRQPLRRQLAAIAVVAVAVALLFSGALAVTSMRTYLLDQVDRQLMDFVSSPDLPGDRSGGDRDGDGIRGPGPRVPSELFIQYYNPDGTPRRSLQNSSGDDDLQQDEDRPELTELTPEEARAQGRQPFTVPGSEGDTNWRVVVRPDRPGSVAVARSLENVDNIVTRLTQLLAIVGVVVVVVVGALVALFVRRSLRPLGAVEETAKTIASGDMTRRVPDYPPTTEAGQVSAAMNRMLDQMEAAFTQREVALAESQASEERMRQFVADASHELRTPLTSIRGFAELYRQGAIESDEVAGTFGRIEGEADRMGALVEDLLELARLDQHRPMERSSVDLLAVCLSVVANTRAAHAGREIGFESKFSGDSPSGDRQVPIVSGDERRIEQIIRNLVENAVAYSTGAVVVVLAIEDGQVRVGVVDHGPGIPDEDKSRIFERFYRADMSRTRNSGGSGLGLSIAQALAEAHLGRLTVADNPEGGSIFTLALPLPDQTQGDQ